MISLPRYLYKIPNPGAHRRVGEAPLIPRARWAAILVVESDLRLLFPLSLFPLAIYLYIYLSVDLSTYLSISLYLSLSLYIYVHIYIYIYIYIYIHI